MSTRALRANVKHKHKQRRAQSRQRMIIAVMIFAVATAGVLIAITMSQAQRQQFSADGVSQAIEDSGTFGIVIGESDAPVTLTEFSDFSCSHCYRVVPTIHRLIDEYVRAGSLRVVYKPITFVSPPNSTYAAQAAICAAQQGKFIEIHDALWGMYGLSGPSSYTASQLAAQARDLSLDMDQFNQCYASRDTARAIEQVQAEAESLGVNGTPTLFVNGQQVPYTGPDAIYASLKQVIDQALAAD